MNNAITTCHNNKEDIIILQLQVLSYITLHIYFFIVDIWYFKLYSNKDKI